MADAHPVRVQQYSRYLSTLKQIRRKRNGMKYFVIMLLLLIWTNPTYANEHWEKYVTQYVRQTYPSKSKLILNIIKKESGFNPYNRNGHCIGLMQINTSVWFSHDPEYNLIKLGVIKSKKDLHNAKLNIKAGVFILKFYNWNYKRYRGQ